MFVIIEHNALMPTLLIFCCIVLVFVCMELITDEIHANKLEGGGV